MLNQGTIAVEADTQRRIFNTVIIGAGASGCVLASRLSEDSWRSVLLIEAGADFAKPGAEHPDLLDPFCLMAVNNLEMRWPGLNAIASTHESGPQGPTSEPYIQGCGVGGASNINGMGADRGLPADYNEWSMQGATGWDWDNVLPYFRKLEHDLDFEIESVHGAQGPMPVRRLQRTGWAPFAIDIADALERFGLPHLQDYMREFGDGFSSVPTNCLLDRRVSVASAYLTRAVRERPNLSIWPNVIARRVLIDGGRAYGAEIIVEGKTATVLAGEVILCAGALQSPALLMRSGIGESSALREVGIPIIKHCAGVGENLQNHPCVSLATYLPARAAQPRHQPWLLQHWLRFSSHHEGCPPSDMHMMAFNKGAWHRLGRRVGSLAISVMKSYASGRVTLSRNDPMAAIDIDFNVLNDPRDEERLIAGVRFALELLADPQVERGRHEVFLPNVALITWLNQRNCRNGLIAWAITKLLDIPFLRRTLLASARLDLHRLMTDEPALRAFVRSQAHVQYHVCGTCRMGQVDEPSTVVDCNGKVVGIEGLRIADASIFPTIPAGYPHFIVMMVAEKLADAIKAA